MTTFDKAFGARLKPLADKATKPELTNALTVVRESARSRTLNAAVDVDVPCRAP